MGKGDKRTKRGKIFKGTFGKFRLKKSKKETVSQSSVQKISSPEPPQTTEEEGIFLMDKVVKTVKDHNQNIKIVVAGYADRVRMKSSPEFLSLPTIAAKSGADIVMLDTYIKDGKGLFDFLKTDQLKLFKTKAKEFGLDVALAGNLRKNSVVKCRERSSCRRADWSLRRGRMVRWCR